MLMISVPVKERLALDTVGTSVRINFRATTLRRIGEYLHYHDKNGKENRCLILDEFEEDGVMRFTAASDGDEDEPHVIIRSGKQ